MDNQENQTQTNENQQPQQFPSDPSVTINAGQGPNANYGPYQTTSPQPIVFQAQDQPLVSPPIPVNEAKHRSPVLIGGGLLVTLCVIAVVGFFLKQGNNKTAQSSSTHSVKSSTQSSSGTITSTTSDIAGEKAVSFGAIATDGTFTVKLLGVTLNPTVTGAQPDAGTQYLEADFSVTSLPNKSNYAFNMLYLPSSVPKGDQMGDIELTPVDGALPVSPLTFNSMTTKNVQITGKTSMETDSAIPSDGSAQTVMVYALFEIKQGDKGQIVWQGINNDNYHFLTQ